MFILFFIRPSLTSVQDGIRARFIRTWFLASANHQKSILITYPNHRSLVQPWFSLFKKKVYEAMVVLHGRSSSLLFIKGVSHLLSKLVPFKKKALSLFMKMATSEGEERWSLLCCGFKKEVMNTRRRCWVTIQLSYPSDS
ncbi:hypothetical protein N665_0865s0002 [Sinapis alba]|nr:hypothetical protein N665_0865s0002 [Sinapis alba]